jgi:hypothetical protein
MSRSPDSLGSSAMEEDEDDFYGNNADGEQAVAQQHKDFADDDEMDQSDEDSDSVFG